jgi:error-prone DNA polymerase
MQPAGNETLARWREAGEWWKGEPDREIHRYIDERGNRREVVSQLLSPVSSGEHTDVRVRRIRDEKVSLATGSYTPSRFGCPRLGSGVLLHTLSAYSLGGTMIAAEIPAFAAEKGYQAVCLADRFSLTGAYEFCRTAKEVGVQPLIGVTVELAEGGDLVLIAKDQIGYRSLSRLVTDCHLQEPRTYPLATWERLARHAEGLICLTGGSRGPVDLMLIRRDFAGAKSTAERLIGLYGSPNVVVQIERSYLPWQRSTEPYLRQLAAKLDLECVPGGAVITAEPEHFSAHDVLICVDTLSLIEEIEGRKPPRGLTQPCGPSVPRRSLNRERTMRTAEDFAQLFADEPRLLVSAQNLSTRCEANVLPGRTELPVFCQDENAAFHQVVELGAWHRYGELTKPQRNRLNREIAQITRLGWARHFLIAWEMCEWAQGERILFSGRGSVVDSMVAYCLGISRIDAFAFKLHFNRFLPPDGTKRPDIDIDFEAARREDVRQHLVQRYGDAHVATVAAIGTYRTRGILREVGKVMGIPETHIAFLSKRLHGGVSPDRLLSALDKRPELRDSSIPREKYHWVFEFAERLSDLPRNLRAHSSGVVISQTPIADTVPVQFSGAEGVKIIQWDKRSAKHAFDKFDILCLRGNDVLGGTMRRVDELDVCSIPLDDEEVYRTMRAGQLIGIPQSASPAMRQAHIRIGTKDLKDAGIVQAGIRPGVGGAVKLNEFVARRQGKAFRYIHPDLEQVLGPTLGIVVFQEQIDQLLETFGGYTGDEAEEIREAIQKHHDRGREGTACDDILNRIVANGYSHQVAQEVFTLVSEFKGYGFAEGHALSFAEVSIRSIYCQQNYPAPYFAALLDAQPAGYYGPATIANEARVRGVKVLPPDVNFSEAQFSVEDVHASEDPKLMVPSGGMRVPLKQISGVSAETLLNAKQRQPYRSFFDFVNRVRPEKDELENLILAGAFDSLTSHRRALLWMVNQALEQSRWTSGENSLPLGFEDPPLPLELRDFCEVEKAIAERRLMGLDVEKHLMAFERPRVTARGGLTAAEASCLMTTEAVFVVGNPIRLRFPPTQSGRRVMFFDLEDETGLLNVTCFDDVYQRDGHKVICHPFVTVRGVAQNRDGHVAFLAQRIFAYQPNLESMSPSVPLPFAIGDFLMV